MAPESVLRRDWLKTLVSLDYCYPRHEPGIC
jgi:hypothetical protein